MCSLNVERARLRTISLSMSQQRLAPEKLAREKLARDKLARDKLARGESERALVLEQVARKRGEDEKKALEEKTEDQTETTKREDRLRVEQERGSPPVDATERHTGNRSSSRRATSGSRDEGDEDPSASSHSTAVGPRSPAASAAYPALSQGPLLWSTPDASTFNVPSVPVAVSATQPMSAHSTASIFQASPSATAQCSDPLPSIPTLTPPNPLRPRNMFDEEGEFEEREARFRQHL